MSQLKFISPQIKICSAFFFFAIPFLSVFYSCASAPQKNEPPGIFLVNKTNDSIYISFDASLQELNRGHDSMRRDCISIDSLNDSLCHLNFKLEPGKDFYLGTSPDIKERDFKNFTVTYKDQLAKQVKGKYYENYGQLRKDLQLSGKRDSALVVE